VNPHPIPNAYLMSSVVTDTRWASTRSRAFRNLNLKDPIPPMERSGIYSYQLKCNCGAQYVGQSSRALQKRLKEHKRDYDRSLNLNLSSASPSPSFSDTVSAMARHCRDNHHDYSNVESSVLHHCEKKKLSQAARVKPTFLNI